MAHPIPTAPGIGFKTQHDLRKHVSKTWSWARPCDLHNPQASASGCGLTFRPQRCRRCRNSLRLYNPLFPCVYSSIVAPITSCETENSVFHSFAKPSASSSLPEPQRDPVDSSTTGFYGHNRSTRHATITLSVWLSCAGFACI